MINYSYNNQNNSNDFDNNKELVVNHLENNREITTKTGLIRSLKSYYKDNNSAIENIIEGNDPTQKDI